MMRRRLIPVRMHRVIAPQVKTASIVQNTVPERRETFRVDAIAAIQNAPTRHYNGKCNHE